MGDVGSPFLAYDIRGRVGTQLDEGFAYDLGQAYASFLGPRLTVVGRDIRLSSKALSSSLMDGLMDGGSNVNDIGVCGTEIVYFATSFLKADGGIMVTASHNPQDHNGFKLVKKWSVPIHGGNGLFEIRDRMGKAVGQVSGGRHSEVDISSAYIDKVLSFIDRRTDLSSYKMVTDAGNGCAGPVLDLISERMCLDLVRVRHDPDGTFPSGVPNPILPENRKAVADALVSSGADIGVAFDGDFDRCFLFDEMGAFTEGYYIVGLLAKRMLEGEKGGKVVHDTRLVWNTRNIVEGAGGVPLMNRTGHAFIKDRMRAEDAVYGGEMSAHHYFRDFFYCDTGMVPWLLVMETMKRTGRPLSQLLSEMMDGFPVSGELNRKVDDPGKVLKSVERKFGKGAISIDHTDGVSIEHARYRLNLRSSNTEPLIRLNVETRGDRELLGKVTNDILRTIDGAV